MPDGESQEYPFSDEAIRAHWHDRERPVCGGYTSFEWNQRGDRDIGFSCSHGPHGCGWWIRVGSTNEFNILVIAEFDLADELHRRYSWQHLDQQATTE